MTWADGPLLGFDLETTAADPMEALPVSFALTYFDGGELEKMRYGLVNPMVPIPPESTAIHGITDAMVEARGGLMEDSIVGILGELMLAESMDRPLVVMNAAYDLTILDRLLKAIADGGGLRDCGWNGWVIDPLVIDRKVDKFRPGRRNLGALAHHYGVELAHAHTAADDAMAAVHVARSIAEEHPSVGGIDPYLLHAQQFAWHREWLADYNEYRAKHDQEPLDEVEGEWPFRGCKKLIV